MERRGEETVPWEGAANVRQHPFIKNAGKKHSGQSLQTPGMTGRAKRERPLRRKEP